MFRKSFLSVLLVLMTACGDPDKVYIDPLAEDSSEIVSQSNGQVRMMTSACGTAPTTNVVHSSDVDAPTIMTTGQIVSGRINTSPNSKNHEHYWDIALEAGYYHVVLESEEVGRTRAKLGLNLTDLNLKIKDYTDNIKIISDSGTDFSVFRARYYGFIELAEARKVILRVTPEFRSQDYRLAVFESESAVPSPFLTDCPTVNVLSLDTTESFILPWVTSWADYQWYRVELDTEAYLLKTKTSHSSGAAAGIQFTVFYVDQFGGVRTGHTVDQTGIDIDGIGRIQLSEPGPIWIRIENNNINELQMEITLTPEN